MCKLNSNKTFRRLEELKSKEKLIDKIADSIKAIEHPEEYKSIKKIKYPSFYCSRMRTALLLASDKQIQELSNICKYLSNKDKNKTESLVEELKQKFEIIYSKVSTDYEEECGDIIEIAKRIGKEKDKEIKKYKPNFKEVDTYKDHLLDAALLIMAYTDNLELSIVALLHELGKFYLIKERKKIQDSIQRIIAKDKDFSKHSEEFISEAIEALDAIELKKEFGIKAIEEKILLARIRKDKKDVNEFIINKALYRSIYKLEKLIFDCVQEPLLLLVTLSTYSSNLGISELVGDQGKFSIKYFSEEALYVLNKFFELNKKHGYVENKTIMAVAEELFRGIKKEIKSLSNEKEVMKSYDDFKTKVELIESYYWA